MSAFRLLGLLLLVPFAVLGLFPLLAGSTQMLDDLASFTLTMGHHQLIEFGHSANGDPYAMVSPLVWVFAGLGQVMIVGDSLLNNKRKQTHVLKIHQ